MHHLRSVDPGTQVSGYATAQKPTAPQTPIKPTKPPAAPLLQLEQGLPTESELGRREGHFYEPAFALLTRIRAQRDNSSGSSHSRATSLFKRPKTFSDASTEVATMLSTFTED